jgi:phosphatidylglycerophosphatase A
MKLGLPPPEVIQKLDFKNPVTWACTWFGMGLMHPAPGTWGTIGALPIGMILVALGGYVGLSIGIAFVAIIGFWAVEKFEEMTGTHDSGMIVIDEVAGLWVALLACVGQHPAYLIGAFVFFRFFDILKPFPVGWIDRNLSGAKGVMLDDIMAGIYAALVLIGIQYALAH